MTVYSLVTSGAVRSSACPAGQQASRASSSLASNVGEQGGGGSCRHPVALMGGGRGCYRPSEVRGEVLAGQDS